MIVSWGSFHEIVLNKHFFYLQKYWLLICFNKQAKNKQTNMIFKRANAGSSDKIKYMISMKFNKFTHQNRKKNWKKI